VFNVFEVFKVIEVQFEFVVYGKGFAIVILFSVIRLRKRIGRRKDQVGV
jgi:hypothetical protein